MQEKNYASLALGILSIIAVFGLPLLSIIFGVLGLVLASLHQKESGLYDRKNSLHYRDFPFCSFLYRIYLTTFGDSLKQKSFKPKAFFYQLFSK